MSFWNKIVLCFVVLSSFSMQAQYGNEWINHSQQYFRFPVLQDGVYKIDYNVLVGASIPVGSISSDNLQVFGKEREQAIHVVDGGDGTMDPGDYLLFYGTQNDGWLDSSLYEDPNMIGNPAYSLYNDTVFYFLTWNSSSSNRRYVVETDNNYGAYSNVADYVWSTYENNFNNWYLEGKRNTYASPSLYTNGEGWGRTHVNGAVPGGIEVPVNAITPYPYQDISAPFAKFHGITVSNSSATYTGFGNHHYKWVIGSSNTVIEDQIYVGYDVSKSNQSFNTDLLNNGTTSLKWQIVNDQGAATDYQSVTYYYIEYPRETNFGGANKLTFKVQNDPQGKIRLDVTNVSAISPWMFVHGETPRIVPFESFGGGYSALIPNSATGIKQEVVFTNESLFINVNAVEAVNETGYFVDYSIHPGGIDSLLLFVFNDKLNPAVDEYKTYRQSAAGGGYNVLSANVKDLYMQFGGGIPIHINGIRRFAKYIYDLSTEKPIALFLIGKGIREAAYDSPASDGAGTRKSTNAYNNSLVPSYGQPSSDIAITANFDASGTWYPNIGTGRISVRTSDELLGYLDKVKKYELEQDPNMVYDTPTKDWQKQVIHFAGGSDASQQSQFQGYMNSYQAKIESDLFGGHVNRVYKNDSDPLNPAVLSDVTQRISDGVSLMTYFGHNSSNTSGFEINLDDPVNWNNYDKYPIMLVNSCYNGNIYQNLNSRSEDFVQIPEYGAIAYISAVNQGLDIYLNTYTGTLYDHFRVKNYGNTLAAQMKGVCKDLYQIYGNNLTVTATGHQMVMNGDPMLRLNWHQKPEIELLPQNVSFSPTDFDLNVDSIAMQIVINNLGRSVLDTISVEVVRDFPSLDVDSIYTFIIPQLDYKDTIYFKMPLQPNVSVGLNNFKVSVDIPSIAAEQYEEITNNQITKSLYINIDGIIPVVPYNYAVVPIDSVTVKGSTIDPLASFKNYRFEIDTVDTYDSPMHRYANKSGLGGVYEINPSEWLSVASGLSDPLVCTDSTVYFWRCSIDSSVYDWKEYSFQYIPGKEGWGQDHFFQFKKNEFVGLDYNRPTRTKDFLPFTCNIQVDAFASGASPAIYNNAWYVCDEQQDYGILNYARKFFVGVFDPVQFEAWGTKFTDGFGVTVNPGHDFGNNNNEFYRSWKYFTFNQDDSIRLENFRNMILNEIPDGFYVVIYSPLTTNYTKINQLDSANIYNMFQTIGATGFQATNPGGPMAMFFRKGDTGSVIEQYAPVGSDAHVTGVMQGSNSYGFEEAPFIGPSFNWDAVFWNQNALEGPTMDSTRLKINYYDWNKIYQGQLDIDFTNNDSLLNLNSMIDAAQFPYIRLKAEYYDEGGTLTPAQMDYWHVLYSQAPEAAIDGSEGYYISMASDTINEGEDFEFAINVKNIYSIDMDSLLISYWVQDENLVDHPIYYARQDSLRVAENLLDTITVSTLGLSGLNSLWMEVNPYVNGSLVITDQPEQQHFNNLIQIPFYVRNDEKNPILDVTFNGDHILNGDIINPNSEVLITLKDDNPFLIMDDVSDTTLFGIYLTDPLGNQTRIPFVDGSGNTVMQWIPADPQNMKFKIIWPAAFDMDGKYTLFVQGTDRSGNISGDIEYRVTFEVIHESTITNMMNYPNPFSTSTRFVFTLTGEHQPDDIIIRIMTVSGRVVREITEDDLGPLQIGRNITEYAWDGTDEFGDPLANGVYLYTVDARINGEEIKHRESEADQYFKKSFGKMYLMR